MNEKITSKTKFKIFSILISAIMIFALLPATSAAAATHSYTDTSTGITYELDDASMEATVTATTPGSAVSGDLAAVTDVTGTYSITKIAGTSCFSGNVFSGTVSFTNLVSVTGDFAFDGCNLTNVDFPALSSVTGSTVFRNAVIGAATDFSSLHIMSGTSTFYAAKFPQGYSFDNLTAITGAGVLQRCDLTNVAFPALTSISGTSVFQFAVINAGTQFPVLSSVSNGGFRRAVMTEIHLPALTSVSGSFGSISTFSDFYVPSAPPVVTVPAFTNITAVRKLHTPSAADMPKYAAVAADGDRYDKYWYGWTLTDVSWVTYDANGGTFTAPEDGYRAGNPGTAVAAPAETSMTAPAGCRFGGWFTAANGGSEADGVYPAEYEKVTYYAHWYVNDPAIALAYSTDGNGAVTEWMLKGDADTNRQVDKYDQATVTDYCGGVISLNAIAAESADIENNGDVTLNDAVIINDLINNNITLPNAGFTFRVTDTPNAGYRVKGAAISLIDGGVLKNISLTPGAPVVGDYALVIAADGTATVTGPSLEYNEVRFFHEQIPNPAIALTFNSNGYAALTEWMLKGDADRDMDVDADDAVLIDKHVRGETVLTGPAFEAADVDGNGAVDAADVSKVNILTAGAVALPDGDFTFRMTVTPNPGFAVGEVTPDGHTPETYAEMSIPYVIDEKGYHLSVAADGKVTLTGRSNTRTDVYFNQNMLMYTIRFDGNGNDGGTVPEDIPGCQIEQLTDIPTDVPTKTGYTFKCWKVNPEYQPGDTFTFDAVHVNNADANNVVTFTAQWTAIPAPPKTPQTGDGGPIGIYTALMFIGITGTALSAAAVIRRKFERTEN